MATKVEQPASATSRRYSLVERERAVQVALEALAAAGDPFGVITRVARELGVGTESLRKWVREAQAARVDEPVGEGLEPAPAEPSTEESQDPKPRPPSRADTKVQTTVLTMTVGEILALGEQLAQFERVYERQNQQTERWRKRCLAAEAELRKYQQRARKVQALLSPITASED